MEKDTKMDHKKFITYINSFLGYNRHNGITLVELEEGHSVVEVKLTRESMNPQGSAHDGLMFSLADTAAGCCACSKGGHCVTSNCTMEFLRPATGKKIFCEATPKKMGRSLSTIQTVLTNDENAVVATGTFTFFMLDV